MKKTDFVSIYISLKEQFELWYPEWENSVCPRRHRLLNENLNAKHKIPLSNSLSRKAPEPFIPNNTDYCHCYFLNEELCVCMYVSVYAYHTCVGANGGQKRTSNPQELEC